MPRDSSAPTCSDAVLTLLDRLARLCAVLAGVLLTAITLMTCVSVIGRSTTGWTIVGDFELTPGAQDRFDRFGALLLGAVMALMTWRTAVGGMSAWKTQAGSMMLGFPEWAVYAVMVPALALTTLIALVQAARGFGKGVTA